MKKLILSIAFLFAIQPLTASASLYSYYQELGSKLPTIAERAVLYSEIADDAYFGTAKQNNLLESYLRGGQLGAVTPQPRLLGDNTWTGTNTFSGTTTLATTTITALTATGTSTLTTTTISSLTINGSMTNVFSIVAGTSIFASSNAAASTTSESYVKVKEMYIKQGGIYTVYFRIKNINGSGNTVRARIYVNGVAVGTERTTADNTYSEDITLVAGDYLQIYAYKYSPAANGAEVSNFQLGANLIPNENFVTKTLE